MAKYIVKIATGESLEITPENIKQVQKEYEANPELYQLEEDVSSKEIGRQEAETMPQRIAEAQQAVMQEDQANENPLMTFAKNAVRTVVPYSAEEMERTGNVTSAGATRDLATAPLRLNPASRLAMFGLGAVRTAIDVGAQSQYGDVDPTRTAIVGGVNALPLVGKPISRLGGFMKDRATKQLYSSIVPNKLARSGRNPIKFEDLESRTLARDVIPIATTEQKAFGELSDYVKGQKESAINSRTQTAREVKDEIPVYWKKEIPEVSHMEAVPNPEFVQAQKSAEAKDLVSKGAYDSQIAKIKRDPYYTFMDIANVQEPKTYVVPKDIDEWEMQKVVEQPYQFLRGAYNRAKKQIQIDHKGDTETANAIIKELDSWYGAQMTKKGSVSAKTASDFVATLNRTSRAFDKTAPQTKAEQARSYLATAINTEIERASPELRAESKEIGKWMQMDKPIEERARASAVSSGTSAFGNILPSADVLSYLNRSPQGAQLKYNLGRMMVEGSPMLKAAYETGRYQLPND